MAAEPDLPPEYFDWLATLPAPCCVVYRKNEWDIVPRSRLTESVRINKDTLPYHGMLAGYVAQWQNNGHESAVGPKKKPFPYTRLAACAVIGSMNGDPLFADPSDGYSLWRLYIDSRHGDIAAVAPSMADWIAKAKPEVLDED